MKKITYVLIVLVFVFSLVNAKNNTDNEVPVLIEADKLTYNNKTQTAVYTGNVVVRKGDFLLTAQEMTILFSEDSNKETSVEKIEAIGNVRFKKGEYSGKANKAQVYVKDGYIKLIGNAKLIKGNNIIEGEIITYFFNTEEAQVIGKDRVRTIIVDEGEK